MLSRPSAPLISAVFILLCFIWGTTWAAIRIGLDGIPPFTGVALRFAIASAVLVLAARVMGVRLGRTRREVGLWIVNAVLSFGIAYGVVYWAEQWVPSGLTAVLFATFTLFVAAMAPLVLGERLTLVSAGGVVLGFAGLAVIYSEDFALLGGPQVALGSAVMLLSPLAAAVASIIVKRWGQGIHPFSLTAVPMGLTALLMGVIAWFFERDAELVFDTKSVGALLYLAVCGSALTFSLYYWLLARVAVTRVSLIAYVTPLIAIGIGVVLFDEPVTARTLTGSLLVMAGVALTVIAPRRRPGV